MEPLLNSLNPAQKEAATTIDQHVRIVAGAGSGKTRVLMARIEYLINEIGAYPNRILAITFTNKAAAEMKERLKAQVPQAADQVRISTIHALCVRILKEDAIAAGFPKNFTILDGDDQKTLLKPFYNDHKLDKNQYPVSRTLSWISNWKTAHIPPEEALKMSYSDESQLMAKAYQEYETAKDTMRAMDFDDLLLNAEHLLKTNEEVRTKWQNRLDYLHVDEFQDVDPVQYSIIRQLTRDDAILCVVGDPDQTIYTWRGANVDIILNFDKDFKPCHTVMLTENYRSTTPILEASNAVVAHNTSRIPKELHTSLPGEDLLVLKENDTERDETNFVARQIQAMRRKGFALSDMAILYRANYCSRSFEKKLASLGIPYQVYGGIRFYDRAEIKDMLSYLKLLSEPDPEDQEYKALNLAVTRVINMPRRTIGAKTVEKIAQLAEEKGTNMLEITKNPEGLAPASAAKVRRFYEEIEDLKREKEKNTLADMIDIIMDYTGYDQMLKKNKEEERLENIQELVKDIQEATRENPNLTLEEYLQNIALFSDRMASQEEAPDCLRLMTVHAAKGTEYPVVFIVRFEESVFPSYRSVNEGGKDALEEERRLLYVGMTRAKKRLFLTWNTDHIFNSSDYREASRFVQEIPKKYVQSDKPASMDMIEKLLEAKAKPEASAGTRKANRPHHYRKGDIIDHAIYGEGVIIDVKDGVANIAFPQEIGVKRIKVNHPMITLKKGRS